MPFIPQFGNPKHIQAVSELGKLDSLKKELATCQAGAKKIKRLKEDIERQERLINKLTS